MGSMWRATVGMKANLPSQDEDDEWDTDPDFVVGLIKTILILRYCQYCPNIYFIQIAERYLRKRAAMGIENNFRKRSSGVCQFE